MAKATWTEDLIGRDPDEAAPAYLVRWWEEAKRQMGEVLRPLLFDKGICARCKTEQMIRTPVRFKKDKVAHLCVLCMRVLELQRRPDLSFLDGAEYIAYITPKEA